MVGLEEVLGSFFFKIQDSFQAENLEEPRQRYMTRQLACDLPLMIAWTCFGGLFIRENLWFLWRHKLLGMGAALRGKSGIRNWRKKHFVLHRI